MDEKGQARVPPERGVNFTDRLLARAFYLMDEKGQARVPPERGVNFTDRLLARAHRMGFQFGSNRRTAAAVVTSPLVR